MGDNDLVEFPPHIGKFSKLEIVSEQLYQHTISLQFLSLCHDFQLLYAIDFHIVER